MFVSKLNDIDLEKSKWTEIMKLKLLIAPPESLTSLLYEVFAPNNKQFWILDKYGSLNFRN